MYFEYLPVHRDCRGNISVLMMNETFEFMRKEEIPVAYVMATGAYSKAAFLKTGFECVDEVLYKDFNVNGKVVFKQVNNIHRVRLH